MGRSADCLGQEAGSSHSQKSLTSRDLFFPTIFFFNILMILKYSQLISCLQHTQQYFLNNSAWSKVDSIPIQKIIPTECVLL